MDWTPVYVGGSVVANWLILYLWQPWGQAYAGEKGKNLARKEDLDTILAEVRAITITQKEIEARLAGDLWSHQMIWNQKKEIYGELIKAALEMQNGYQAIRSMMAVNAEVPLCIRDGLKQALRTRLFLDPPHLQISLRAIRVQMPFAFLWQNTAHPVH